MVGPQQITSKPSFNQYAASHNPSGDNYFDSTKPFHRDILYWLHFHFLFNKYKITSYHVYWQLNNFRQKKNK